MKKFLPYILIVIALVGMFSPVTYAAVVGANCKTLSGLDGIVRSVPGNSGITQCVANTTTPTGAAPAGTPTTTSATGTPTAPPTTYQLLAPIGGIAPTFDPAQPSALGAYLNTMIQVFIGICAVLAVVMIILGGLEYMTSELPGNKSHGKERITSAIFGLILALGAYALLFTINPDLLNTEFKIPDATVTVSLEDLGGENESIPFAAINNATLQARGISCDGNGGKTDAVVIGKQFIGKSTYSMPKRNTFDSSTIYMDCSSFVAQVYSCAGLPNPGGTTAAMFSGGANTRAVTGAEYNFNLLNPGDLVGWKKGDNGSGKKVEGNGHVMIYLGGGKVLHSSSTSGGVTISDLSAYKARITYIKFP